MLQKMKHPQAGFTLVELLVTILIGLLLTLAVLVVQMQLSRTNMQLTDAGQRNDQARTALDLLQRDIGNALYMVGGTAPQCAATVQYTGLPAAPTTTLSAVTARPQPAPLPTSTPLANPLLRPDAYSAAAIDGTNASHLIAITLVPSALRAAPAAGAQTAPYKVVHNIVATAPPGQQAVADGLLPLNNIAGVALGDVVTLLVPLTGGPATGLACLRFAVGGLGAVTAGGGGSVPAVQLPTPGTFSHFTQPLRDAGLLSASQPLANSQLVGAKLRNEGPAAGLAATQTLAYYVATVSNGASGTVPVLVRATVNADGTLAAQPTPVAAGVVSLQALFGVDGTSASAAPTGSVTNYRTWQQVESAQMAGRVRTVLYAIVTRTMQSHPQNPQVKQIAIPSPQLAVGDPTFTAFRPRTAEEQRDRFTVHTAEVALRNQIWAR
ncbi:MAG: prepilin-type N-terminal cleavage/methylation domain-containing protein [Burkholderiaceae bacterium]|nr:MAG: prepilin-type N-terminal cleavage/methylation domain-containing protein [Burkholderiaceae bacterium]